MRHQAIALSVIFVGATFAAACSRDVAERSAWSVLARASRIHPGQRWQPERTGQQVQRRLQAVQEATREQLRFLPGRS